MTNVGGEKGSQSVVRDERKEGRREEGGESPLHFLISNYAIFSHVLYKLSKPKNLAFSF